MITLFYIITLAINLTSGYSKDFFVTIDNDDMKYHVLYINNNIWTAETIQSGTDTIDKSKFNFKVEKQTNGTILTSVISEQFQLNLNRFFKIDKTDWKNATTIKTKFKNNLIHKTDEVMVVSIKREKNKIHINNLSEESLGGYCKKVIIEW